MSKAFLSAVAFALLTSLAVPGHAASSTQSASDPVPAVSAEVAVVKINSADAETLTRELKGIGPTKAKAIIDYRDNHGPFQSVDELLEVKGIGAATLEKNRSKLSL
ncbi:MULTISPECIES: ComEA family DNA-binding protein [Stutzerimonas stutzeri group]|nr:helix-hairpin-helix repeat-containing competence protein ComEA [Stutzerimonas stutzeri TS44]EKM93664.1 helix-hairpin-helix repeat-containing competence protein ComEA [Stutzerimonas degradans]MCF6753216.1 helix-hairpin-helix domain-containing protein [Stutzerimonas stutzeri]